MPREGTRAGGPVRATASRPRFPQRSESLVRQQTGTGLYAAEPVRA
jgi:hypothetical protein